MLIGLKHGDKEAKKIYREIEDLRDRTKEYIEEEIKEEQSKRVVGLIDHIIDVSRENGFELDPEREFVGLIEEAREIIRETFDRGYLNRVADRELKKFDFELHMRDLVERAKTGDPQAMRVIEMFEVAKEIEAQKKRTKRRK